MKISVGPEVAPKRAVTVRFVPKDARGKITPAVPEAEFSGKANAFFYVRQERVLYVGLGLRASMDAATFRSAAGAATIFLKKIGEHHLMLQLDEWPQFAGAAVEGTLLADYRFEHFKTKKTDGIASLSVHVLAGDTAAVRRAVTRSQAIAESTNAVRDIGNLPGNLLYPATLAAHAEKLGRKYGFKIKVLTEKELKAGKFGGLIAVGQGSVRPPRMIVIEHRGGAKTEAPVALVGKAITFDTGGISIKPAANMEEMIFDKCGGIAVLGAMAAIAALGVKRNVVGVIASAENMPSGNAYRPGDIVTTYDGKHIEIVNTDAEGRVVLADAIAYARIDLKAAAIVDLATLTGACGVALGEYAAGFWSSDDKLRERMLAAAATAGEVIWPMPLFDDYERQIRSDVALIKNSGGRLGGACTAAAFLRTFAEETPWAHLDIAYTAHREKDRADLARGATGFGIRTLVELVERWK
ncbi:MAG TPA: leucyl aminopeptidase [Chthoniobacter sp.]|nr:leucyl aminopeptidase [Chthoniobacter sp.]